MLLYPVIKEEIRFFLLKLRRRVVCSICASFIDAYRLNQILVCVGQGIVYCPQIITKLV